MQATYKRDMNCSYLVLKNENMPDTTVYPIRMLTENQISSFLPFQLQSIDGEALLYYDISGKQSLEMLYERKTYRWEDLGPIFKGIMKGLEQTASYLLYQGDLVLMPEYIYMNMEEKAIYLCYFPGYQREVQKQFQEFMEYLLPKIDTGDDWAVEISYRLYRQGMDNGFQVERLKEELYQMRFAEGKIYGRTEATVEEDKRQKENFPVKEEQSSYTDKEEEPSFKKAWLQSFLFLIAGILCLGAAVFLRYHRGLAMLSTYGGIFLAIGGILAIIYGIHRLRRKCDKLSEDIFFMPENPREEMVPDEAKQKEKLSENEAVSNESMETTVLYQNVAAGQGILASKQPNQYPTIFLEKEMVVVGKLEVAADIILDSPAVSRIHARVCKKGEEYYLTDLNSRNGTCVNGKILQGEEEYLLKNYDEVIFADVPYIFVK